MPGTPRFLTLADVAEVLNTSSAQVYALVRRGDLAAIKIGGRGQWRVEADQLEAYIARMYDEARTFVSEHPYDGGRDPASTSRSPEAGRTAQPTSESERHLHGALLAVAGHGEPQRLAGLVRADGHDQGDAVGDPLAVHPGDQVALLQPAASSAGVPRRPRSIEAPVPSSSPVCTLAPITG